MPDPGSLPESANKYQILGVAPGATPEDLRVAYRRLALLYHPDRQPAEEQEPAGRIFGRIASAYSTLSDPGKRQRYDLALSRNEVYHETPGTDTEGVSLAEILSGIDAYEHIFSASAVARLSATLDQIVEKSLIRELDEQVVEAWPLPSAPSGSKHRGSFQSGALVLTNIRVLLPFTYTWQETHGNVRTTYTGAGMPVLPLPFIESITVIAEKRMRRKLWIDFRFSNGSVRVRSRRTNLAKLLLIAQLWGIRVEARHDDARTAELVYALARPWQWAGGLFALFILCATVVGLFSDNSILDNILDWFDYVRNAGLWQWTAVVCAAICARRLWRWVFAYSAMELADTIRPSPSDPARAAAPSSSAAR
jgi:hypothetical protein